MFYERLKSTCNLRGTNITKICNELNISTANTGRWKSGGMPSVEVLSKLANILDVSTDYLLGKTDAKKPPAETEGLTFHIKDNNLRAEVEELVNAFLTLDRSGRILVTAKAIEEQRAQAACDAAKQINETA